MKRTLIILAFTAVVVLAMAAPAYARDGTTDGGDDTTSTIKNVVDTTTTTVDDTTSDVSSRVTSLQERIAEKKSELEDKLKQKQEDRKEKLEGRRLARCQNRETAINTLLDKSAAVGKARLAKIQRIEAGVKAFYEKQQLTSTEYATVLQTVDAKEAAAIAALDVVDNETFSCDQVDGAKPSDTIHTTNEAKRTALTEYRASVQDLIRVVRQAFVAKQQTSGVGNE